MRGLPILPALLLTLAGWASGCGQHAVSDPMGVVPNLRGKTPKQAVEALRGAHFCTATLASASNGPHVKRNQVVDQDPAAGARVPQSTLVNVWIHYGARRGIFGNVVDVCGLIYEIRNVSPG